MPRGSRHSVVFVQHDDGSEDDDSAQKKAHAQVRRSQRGRFVSFVYGLAHVLIGFSAQSVARASVVDPYARLLASVGILLTAFNGLFWMFVALVLSDEYAGVVEKSVDPLDALLTAVNLSVTTLGFAYAAGVRNRNVLCLVGVLCVLHGVAQLSLEHAVFYCICLRPRRTRGELLLPFALLVTTFAAPTCVVLLARGAVAGPNVFAWLACVAGARFAVQLLWVTDMLSYAVVLRTSKATQAARLAGFLYCFTLHSHHITQMPTGSLS